MTNNLQNLIKDVKGFAKRCKDFKYTEEALLTFLLSNTMVSYNVFSATTTEEINLKNYKLKIFKSASEMRQNLKNEKRKNNRLINEKNLELIKLMEQGDHVVKSPWSSWQYAANTFYNNWHGKYTGKGNKEKNVIYKRNSKSMKFSQSYGKSTKYGITTLGKVMEAKASIPVSAAITPKSINKEALTINLPTITAPAAPNLIINVASPEGVTAVSPDIPTINPQLPSPNTNPFVDYNFNQSHSKYTLAEPTAGNDKVGAALIVHNWTAGLPQTKLNDKSTVTAPTWSGSAPKVTALYSGIRPDRTIIDETGYVQNGSYVITKENRRSNNIVYAHGGTSNAATPNPAGVIISNFSIYAAGARAKNSSLGRTMNTEGQLAIHTINNVGIKNVNGYLYGKAAFVSIETWHGGNISLENVKVNVEGEDNTLFYILPSDPRSIHQTNYSAHFHRGSINGTLAVDLNSKGNIVYSVLGTSGSFGINSKGTYNLTGAKNIIYSGLGYSPNFAKFKSVPSGAGTVSADDYWTPSLILDNPPNSYGDENIILFFGDLIPNANQKPVYGGNSARWQQTAIGIYQGEIEAKARIGDLLFKGATGTPTDVQDLEGETIGNNKYVEQNVGIFAASGQRMGIVPSKDLGSDNTQAGWTSLPKYDNDLIHSLQINKVDITFGKYSKDNIMLYSKNGTVMNVATPTNAQKIVAGLTTNIKDYSGTPLVASDDDTQNQVATGTILALASGIWSNSTTNMQKFTNAKTSLQNLPSEINIGNVGATLELSARYKKFGSGATAEESFPIAYASIKKGKVTSFVDKTTARSHGSIIGYAASGGVVTAYGNIEAKDKFSNILAATDNTKKLLYKNIGGYATGIDSTVTLGTTKADTIELKDIDGTTENKRNIAISATTSTIYGTGAIAADNGTVNLRGTTNIDTGTNGALVALTGGTVNYSGGTINSNNIYNITKIDNGEDLNGNKDSHLKVMPFYADNNGSKVSFEGDTTLNIGSGILIFGEANEYKSAPLSLGSQTGVKYYGMGKIDVNINGNGVNVGAFKGLKGATAVTWNGSSGYLAGLNSAVPNFKSLTVSIDPNTGKDYRYKSSLINGELIVDTDVDLNDESDGFNNITMENEWITINSSKSIVGIDKGLSIGSNTASMRGITPTYNTKSGYDNRGAVTVTSKSGKNLAAINVSYGTIKNRGTVSVDSGAALYGTNGSKLINETNGILTITNSGTAMYGKGTDTANKQGYGTDILPYSGTPAGLNPPTTYKTVEMENNGTINMTFINNAIAMYADNNTGASKSQVTVTNNGVLNVGIEGVGVTVLATAPGTGYGSVNHNGGSTDAIGGTVYLNSTTTTPGIITDKKGKGVYAQESEIHLNNGGTYAIETKDNGAGIYASKNTFVLGTLDYHYTGSNRATGIGILYDLDTAVNKANINLINTSATTGGMIGIYNNNTNAGIFTNNGNITGTSSVSEYGIVTEKASIQNNGNIILANATKLTTANVGIYSKSLNTVTNNGSITVGDNTIGIYGYKILNNKNITAGDNGTAIYSNNGDVKLSNSSVITVGNSEAVGVYSVGSGQDITADAGAVFNIGDSSFGFVNVGRGNNITTKVNSVTVGNDSVYVYTNDDTGTVKNYTNITTTGYKNYGIYSSGNVENHGNMDFRRGIGNVGIYSTKGIAENWGIIDVGETNLSSKIYGIGMATGYHNPITDAVSNQGTIINYGIINVTKDNSIGMYAVGSGAKAINASGATINLSGKNTTGMYIDKNAIGENYGTIKTIAIGNKIKGVVAINGGIIKNYGTITIEGATNMGVYTDDSSLASYQEQIGSKNDSTVPIYVASTTDEKTTGGVRIAVPPATVAPIVTDSSGKSIPIVKIDTNIASPTPTSVTLDVPSVSVSTIDLVSSGLNNYSSGTEVTNFEMYIDTSGVNYTNPIQGLHNLRGLEEIDLYFGIEATRYTTSKAIEIGDNILKPYNDALSSVVLPGMILNAVAGSLTWEALPTKNPITGLLDKVYLAKADYKKFALENDKNTYNFFDGLEQRYGVETLNSRENQLFQKLNSLGKGEKHIFTQAVDEMKGHQYSNLQYRINATGNALDKEFDYLKKDWRNPSKQNNKIKVFGMRDEYKTSTAGVIDYTSNIYGVAYIHEDEAIKMGNSSGWYAGAVTNRFRFKDIGHSRENQTIIKAGIFKTMSPKFDHNGALRWTIGGDVFTGVNEMKRKYLNVNDIFEAKSDSRSYGVALKSELGYDVRMSQRMHLRPFGTLKMEYGKFSNINEDNGQIRLEIKQNDYVSIKPQVGVEFKYIQPLAVRTNLSVGFSTSYENELGKLQKGNQARVRYTTAGWYDLEKEKEDRRGTGKFDLKVGIDNTRFGITVNAGYDTKGKNIRGGIGFRAIY